MTEERIAQLVEEHYPYEHVGYTAPRPDNCFCDECYTRGQERIAFENGMHILLEEQRKELDANWKRLIGNHPEVMTPYETCTYCHSTTGFHHFNCESKRL